MTSTIMKTDRRKEPRIEANDTIRWKRPGRVEDNKAWMVNRSSSSLGFLTAARITPTIGEVLNIRRLEADRWATVEQTVRVARIAPTMSDDLIMIGCSIE